MKRALLPVLSALGALSAFGQSDLTGPYRYPQYRSFSGLPGGGFAVSPDGKIDIRGALSLSTPIGYTLGKGSYALGIGNLSENMEPRLPKKNGAGGNGSAWAMGGFDLGSWRASYTYFVQSAKLDHVHNFQFSPALHGLWGVAFGVQDLRGHGGSSGEKTPSDFHSSRSLYAVATRSLPKGMYISLGTGSKRFSQAWGNLSAPLGQRARGFVEYDRFNWNVGLDWSPKLHGLVGADFTIGVVRGKYALIGLTLHR